MDQNGCDLVTDTLMGRGGCNLVTDTLMGRGGCDLVADALMGVTYFIVLTWSLTH